MIIEIQTRRIIEDNGKCENCKYNVGEIKKDKQQIFCDLIEQSVLKNGSCKDYKFEKAKE